MRGIAVKIALLLAACLVTLGVAGSGSGRGTLVFGGSADPTYLDPALVSDGESFRVTEQIYEGLVQLVPGKTTIKPELARSWKISKDGKTYTFFLRRGVKFHDGTPFNAAAVCANFNRWFNFKGPFQDASATFYYQSIFTGFRRNESKDLGKPLYRSCRARGAATAIIRLTRTNGPFLPSLSLSAFAMQSPTAMRRYGANQGELRSGVFRPTGSYAFEHPTGTGPFRFVSWKVGEKVELAEYKGYKGDNKAKLARVIIRPISTATGRLQALQAGEVNAYDLADPAHLSTIRSNSSLKVINRPSFNVAYVTINAAKPPMDKLNVRKAVAYGLDRNRVVQSFYAGRAVVAHEFMPPGLLGYNPRVTKYPFNPERAKSLLRAAGLTLPVEIDFWYPTNISRPYMPNPKLNFEAFAASLEQSGFKVNAHSAPWRPDYVAKVNEGSAGHLNLIGWSGDYGDPDNFVGTFFQDYNPQFGFRNARITRLLNQGEAEFNLKKRAAIYRAVNREIMNFVPGVPYAHTRPALGMQKRVQNYIASPTGSDRFFPVSLGGQ
ncbi:MAG TPA: ABC transporter substrate-binding protein [Gaiellaceae bacterium]|nr:ABC transporter substrate-binding protein [Gaiellaceae bacterium]